MQKNQIMTFEMKDGCLTVDGRQVFKELSFVAEAGTPFRLSMSEGEDRTLLAKTLMGLWPLDSGCITIDGALLTDHSAPYLRRMMAYVPHELPDEVTGLHQVLREISEEGKHIIIVDMAPGVQNPKLLDDYIARQQADGKIVIIIDDK